jgi:general secretion pathway protein A
MYLRHYGFQDPPFSVTPDPKFFFETRDQREALAYLHYGVRDRKGFLVVVGEVGVGKTICLRSFLRQLGNRADSALLLSTSLEFPELLTVALEDFGVPGRGKKKVDLLLDLNAFLLQADRADRDVVLIIDEAQNLSASVLEELRQLSNLETDDRKLLTIILAGQPELRDKLGMNELRQLRQRIPGICAIRPLTFAETRSYIEHRLRVAGGSRRAVLIADGAYEWIHAYAGGVPRLVNIVCDRALLIGYVEDRSIIDETLVRQAVRDLERGSVERRSDVILRPGRIT